MHPFLAAASADAANTELAGLMELATALIVRVARHRTLWASASELEDAVSEARIQLLTSLQRLRREDGFAPAIADFETYTCAVAAKTCAQLQRERDPERAKVVNRLLYLLKKCPTQQGFALWTVAGGVNWVGFEGWQDLLAPAPACDARRLQLLTDPRAVAALVFGAGGWSSVSLPDLVAGLLAWLGGPLKFSDLADTVARLQEAPVALRVLPDDARSEALALDAVDPGPSPCDDLRWKEYLVWLWRQTAGLTPPQRHAFLLHSHCLHELEFAGLTSVRQAAAVLGLAAERLAELWPALPLDDLAIGALLGVGRQQVINWRKAARVQLGRAWHEWSAG